jgi:predicted outer membrane repeat protein
MSQGHGGGVWCDYFAGPTMTNCTIIGNRANIGGGIHCNRSSSLKLTNCTINGNSAVSRGGGVSASSSNTVLTGCKIAGNTAGGDGGGIRSSNSTLLLINCTISANYATGNGGGIWCTGGAVLTNCVLWGNAPQEAHIESGSSTMTYCCVGGGWSGTGNVDADPLFSRPPSDGGDGWGDAPATQDIDEGANDDFGDLRLTEQSPCIDAGTNGAVPADEMDLDDDEDTSEPLPFGLAGGARFVDDPLVADTGRGIPPIVDIGAYEYQLYGDCDLNWTIDMADYASFAGCVTGPRDGLALGCGCADIDIDNDVDLFDFAAFASRFAAAVVAK